MKMFRNVLFIGVVVIVGVFHLSALRWGVPSVERFDMVLGEQYHNEHVYRTMSVSHADLLDDEPLFTASQSLTQTLAPEMTVLPTGARIIYNTEASLPYFLSLSRSFLLRTYEPDITNLLNAFSSIDPRAGDFFPNNFIYGLVMIGVYGGWLFVLSLCQCVVLVPDMTHYLLQISDIAAIYVALRVLSFCVSVVSAFFVYGIAARLTTRWWGVFAGCVYACLPVTIVTTYEVKPHALGVLFLLAMWYAYMRSCENDASFSRGFSLLSGVAGACAIGAVPTAGAYVAVFLGILVVPPLYRRDWGTCTRRIWWYVLPCVCVSVIVMGNVFVHFDAFLLELSKQERFYGVTIARVMRVIPVLCRELAGAVTWPVSIVGVFGVCVYRRWRVCALLVMLMACVVFVKFATMAFALRFSLIVCPLLCIGVACVGYVCIRHGRTYLGYATAGVCLCAVVYMGGLTAYDFYCDTTNSATRIQAGAWINAHVPRDSLVGVPKVPINFAVPPFRFHDYSLYIAAPAQLRGSDELPEYYVITDRAGAIPTQVFREEGFELVALFSSSPLLDFPLFRHSRILGYVNPTIHVYKRISS